MQRVGDALIPSAHANQYNICQTGGTNFTNPSWGTSQLYGPADACRR